MVTEEQYYDKISNKFVALRNFDENVDMNMSWKITGENVRT
jgi:hypothetical protein